MPHGFERNALWPTGLLLLLLSVLAHAEMEPPFPRLGMWWPDPRAQSLEAISRYDWVILDEEDKGFIDAIRATRPEVRLLNSTNACELDFDPEDPEGNADLQGLPADWFLTQVGSRLQSAIDASQTRIAVERLSIAYDGEEITLFEPGDTALIDGESLLIESVDTRARTLNVKRGYIRPASAHPAQARIAAHVSFWPNSWVMNLASTRIAMGPAGPETWADFNARRAIQQLADPRWNGLLVDRADGGASWLIDNSTARTLDPDQTNQRPRDYTAFDSAWNAGLERYLRQVREAVGWGRMLLANWGKPDYDLLNGNNFEGVPSDSGGSYSANWHRTIIGPWADSGSYFEWLRQSPKPNLTMLQTYEDDAGADPYGDGRYDNRCDDPDFEPNYRKMRFGLATALLGDGHFSYEMSTNGHGSLCLLWFDEYDNAGAGRGYLGYPLGEAYRLAPAGIGGNLLTGGGFEWADDLEGWSTWADKGYAIEAERDATTAAEGSVSMRLTLSAAAGEDWRAAYSFEALPIGNAKDYTVSFHAKADRPRALSLWVQQGRAPWTTWLDLGSFQLTTSWQRFELPATAIGSDAAAVFNLGLGQSTGFVWIDGMELREGNLDLWRRDYQAGIVLVNATQQAADIDLVGQYRKIRGNQAPLVNDGSLVTRIHLPPQDGILLLRP